MTTDISALVRAAYDHPGEEVPLAMLRDELIAQGLWARDYLLEWLLRGRENHVDPSPVAERIVREFFAAESRAAIEGYAAREMTADEIAREVFRVEAEIDGGFPFPPIHSWVPDAWLVGLADRLSFLRGLQPLPAPHLR